MAEVAVDGEQHLDVGVAQHPAQLRGLGVGVEQRDHARRSAWPPASRRSSSGLFGASSPTRVPLPDARRQQAPGQRAPSCALGLGVGEALVAEDGERLVAEPAAAVADELAGRRA